MAKKLPPKKTPDPAKLDQIVARARRERDEREGSYRERALKILPWVCGRCAREFAGDRLRALTVHHRDGNHDNNPPDGSNWELLCVYCHDDEHQRQLARSDAAAGDRDAPATHRPFAALEGLLKGRK